MKSTSSSIKLLLAVVVLAQCVTISGAASELPLRLEVTNSSSVLCSAAAISIAADLVLLGILQARSAYSTFLLKASMDHFHLTTRKAACIERVCCEDDCYDIDTFYDVDSVA
jgi:hypothetical protein